MSSVNPDHSHPIKAPQESMMEAFPETRRVVLGARKVQAGAPLKKENLEPSSLMRRIIEVVFKVLVNVWRSLGSYFGNVSIDIAVKNSAKNLNAERIYQSLKQKRTLGQSTVSVYCDHLDKIYGTLTQDLYFGFSRTSLAPKTDVEKVQLLFFPVMLKGSVRNHIVAVVFDKISNRVELYDSKGLTSLDRTTKVINTNKTLSDVMLEVHNQYVDPERNSSSWENKTKHQKDSHNCGVYTLDYFERRAKRESPEKIAESGLSFSKANNETRIDMIKELFPMKISSDAPETRADIQTGIIEEFFS